MDGDSEYPRFMAKDQTNTSTLSGFAVNNRMPAQNQSFAIKKAKETNADSNVFLFVFSEMRERQRMNKKGVFKGLKVALSISLYQILCSQAVWA